MATGLLNTTNPSQNASPNNPNGIYRPQMRSAAPSSGATADNPYAGGFNLNPTAGLGPINYYSPISGRYDTSTSTDADAQALQHYVNEAAAAHAGLDKGVSYNDNAALQNLYRGRLAEKNSLSEQIGALPGQEKQQESLLTGQAGQSLGQGLKNTRQNFNNRGLLYSGMRQAGEQQVKQGIASNLDSAISGSRKDSANALSSAQNAYASVDLQQAQQSLELANQAFDTANANNIARLQAMQQLGQGVGAAVGAYAGSRSPSTQSPTTGWSPQQLQMPQMGSQYSPAVTSGLVQEAP